MLSEMTAAFVWVLMILGFGSVWLESRKSEVLEPVERTQAPDHSNVIMISSHAKQPYDWETEGL